ncbi:MAG: glycosyltransferase family 4 protein [Candidatus Gorgyraea atricola]|nr:glycosyltransferase family 4 protein [Candidatus Gorgyraea atricola]
MGLTEPLLHSQVLNYLKILRQSGISVCILSYEKRRLFKKHNVEIIKEDLNKAGIKWISLGYHKRFQFLAKPYDIIRGMFVALYISIAGRVDVIHARGTFCALIGILPCLILKKKMVFDMRGLMAEEYVDAGLWKKNSMAYKIVDRLEQYFIRRADEVIVLTGNARELILSKGRTKNITLIPACTDLNRFRLKDVDNGFKSGYSLDKKFILIYTGSLGTWYMLSEMLDFYKELLRVDNSSAFFILSQTSKAWIEQYIPDNIKKNVIVDSSSPENVVDFLNLADVGIFFIKSCFSKRASCPTKFGEYLACGLPVVINKGIGDTEEIVRKNRVGVVVEDFSAQEYRKKIEELKELLKEGDALRRRCRDVAERHFSLAQGGKKYVEVYKRLKAKA